MNALTRWNQLRQLEALQHGLGSLFSRSQGQWPEGQEEQIAVPEWAPLVDISEDDKEYLIKAELPEVKKEDVKVTAEEGTLTITGERKFEKEEKGKKYHRVERSYGSFVRNFSFPDDASPAKVSAEFKDGVLSVHLAKTEKAKPQQIEVKVANSLEAAHLADAEKFATEKRKQTENTENMNKQTQATSNDMGTLAEDARALMAATADVAGEKVAEARKRLAAALDSGKEIYGRVRDKAVESAKAADEAVHEHPYQAIGIAFGVGALIGYLAARRCCRNCD